MSNEKKSVNIKLTECPKNGPIKKGQKTESPDKPKIDKPKEKNLIKKK